MMTFQWPLMLWLLLAIPLLVGLYVLILRRKKRTAVRYANLSLVNAALGVGNRLRRHVPPVLFLIALALMLLAAARPTALVLLPTQQETIILAIDVSGSMRAADVLPNRLQAAQAAGRQGGSRSNLTISMAGARSAWSNYTLDGITNTDINFNPPASIRWRPMLRLTATTCARRLRIPSPVILGIALVTCCGRLRLGT